MEKGIFMKTQKNEEAFKEFCIMTPFAAREVDCWYDGKDFYEVIEKNHNEDDYSGALIMKNVENMECESGM